VAKTGQRLRHNPGETRLKKSRDTSEGNRSPNWCTRRMPHLVPYRDGLHARRQRGISTETHFTARLAPCLMSSDRTISRAEPGVYRSHVIQRKAKTRADAKRREELGVSNLISNRE
jgi:hypothetical protein